MVTACTVISLEHLNAHKFALSARYRLCDYASKASDSLKPFLVLVDDFEAALDVLCGRLWVCRSKSFKACRPIIDVRVILHCAGTKREAASVWRYILFSEARVELAKFGGSEAGYFCSLSAT